MHTCVRCGREATLLEEINTGCPCGSKVFVFGQKAIDKLREEGVQAALDSSSETLSDPASQPPPSLAQAIPSEQLQQPSSAEAKAEDAPAQEQAPSASKSASPSENGKAPESYFARTTFTHEDVENIKIVSEGVFFVDVNALSNNPVVLKDEEGVYYVRLPVSSPDFDEGKKKENGEKKENGKKE